MSPGVCRYQAIDFVHDFAGDLKMQRMRMFSGWAVGMVVLGAAAAAPATPAFVTHGPGDPVFNVPGATQRDPLQPRESETIRAYFKTGPSFSYTSVAVYYTTDGSEPVGSKGIPNPGTLVLLSFGPDIKVNFLFNEPLVGGTDDWWEAVFPPLASAYATRIRYKIGVWDGNVGGSPEVFANGGQVFEWTNKLAWPGAGAPDPNPSVGYPPYYAWKEEGVVGNNYINVMLDQNGAVYDIYYPSAGCVRGMGTKNEGYVDGLDTFPPLLPPGDRGQMNLNQAFAGIRVNGTTTYWQTNENGVGYSDVDQNYVPETNVIATTQRLTALGKDILVQQFDFSPKGIAFPTDDGGDPNRGIYVKRYILTNQSGSAETVNFYFYADFALNGGDSFDDLFTDAGRGAMVARDTTQRFTSSSGEYNPTTTGDYNKDVSVYLAASLKVLDSVGGATGTPATDFWSDTSGDTDRGWLGVQVELPAGGSKEINVAFVGGFDNFPNATGTYDFQMDQIVDWFLSSNMSTVQAATETYWRDWLDDGVSIDTPDDDYDELFERGLLATALHLDGANGGIIAGMHNGAYPFVWPRDGVWAAVTLDRAGHTPEAEEIYRFLRDIAFRAEEEPGRKAWWYQKYTTDGHIVWSAPQVDETSVYPWGTYYHYLVTGDLSFLDSHYATIFESGRAMSEDSSLDTRIFYNDSTDLMYSNNLWEDSFDEFIYSNASVVRGLEDAARVADVLDQNVCPGGPGTCNYHNDKALFEGRATAIRGGLANRMSANFENTDISQLGTVYPFEVFDVNDPLVTLYVDRMNGVAMDTFGNTHPIVNFGGEWDGLINRYWGDTYWHNTSGPNPNASPWFLTTMWYGCYYGVRQDTNPGKGDIDNHKYRLDLLVDRLGPIGFGAEQIAPSNSLLYPGQMDFVLQTAWPNAWESMAFFVDALMLFVDYVPDAPGNTLRIEPKLPTGWSSMTYRNLHVGTHRIDVTCTESDVYPIAHANTFTNRTGAAVDFDTHIRIPAGAGVQAVARNGVPVAFTYDSATGRVHVTGALATGVDAETEVAVYFGVPGDADGDGDVETDDFVAFPPCMTGPGGTAAPECVLYDFDVDGDVDLEDYAEFAFLVGLP
jgi:GH15 family glucan-1,4-alpha-glucosidase